MAKSHSIKQSNPVTPDQLGRFVNSPGEAGLTRLWKPVNLTPEAVEMVCNAIPERSKSVRRFFIYLATTKNPQDRFSTFCHTNTSISNLSDVKADANDHLKHFGLYIDCDLPNRVGLSKRKNQFGEKANDHIWSLFQMYPAANDSEYNQD